MFGLGLIFKLRHYRTSLKCKLPPRADGIRFVHVHRNLPGMLRRINEVFSSRDVNVNGQFLQTDGDLGYVVMEADAGCDSTSLLPALRSIEGTLRTRFID